MLTICIPTIPARQSLLSRLLWTLTPQMKHQSLGLEVLIAQGDWPLGDKVNTMFAAAAGTHVVVVDDDDNVHPNYEYILGSFMQYEPLDMYGYHLLWTEAGKYMASPLHHGDGHPNNGIDDRGACVKVPIRVEIARSVQMGNSYYADHEWAMAVHPQIETHRTIREHMYHYDHWNDRMVGTDLHGEQASWYKRPQRDVGKWPYDPDLFTWIGDGR